MRGRVIGLWLIGLVTLAACNQGGSSGPERVDPATVKIPSQILGLQVHPEDISNSVQEVDRSYLDGVGMFSLRDGDLLRASLQVSRFNSAARIRSDETGFRRTIIGLLGTQTPQEIKVGDIIVYSTSGNEQIVYAWFKGAGMYVLSVHRDFEFPRTLLRRALQVEI